jgi:hypothetical protein
MRLRSTTNVFGPVGIFDEKKHADHFTESPPVPSCDIFADESGILRAILDSSKFGPFS